MAFELETTTAKLIHLNPRPEKHGEENVPACDLKVQVQAGSEILSMIHPTLRAMLYKPDEQQGQIAEALPTVRRFGNLIERLRLGVKLVGASVVIGFGLGGAGSDIELDTVDVDGFSAELMEGGRVILTFRIKATPSGEQMKRLYEVMGGEIDISITPAQEKQQSLGLNLEPETA
ncbi:hypothetical protein DAI43_17030 [Achromobacter xylosoxidans]|uniref:hypothetical protein n=1 Tax=Achromobacter aegrifaciens TaxID=1287736 RepID=UPI000D4937EA|nr:hypothetical protein [Achromobacter aegrifaciens]MDQ1758985.1 hypothetical protein [Achromobacter aegrifaciens]PTN50399.1 hypothetical protein DAI43_17030 [Achromobacter xylosoxidans]